MILIGEPSRFVWRRGASGPSQPPGRPAPILTGLGGRLGRAAASSRRIAGDDADSISVVVAAAGEKDDVLTEHGLAVEVVALGGALLKATEGTRMTGLRASS